MNEFKIVRRRDFENGHTVTFERNGMNLFPSWRVSIDGIPLITFKTPVSDERGKTRDVAQIAYETACLSVERVG